MTGAFLRRRPQESRRWSLPTRASIVRSALALGIFALCQTKGAADVTRLTRQIQERKSRILALESELAYLARQEGAYARTEHAGAVLDRAKGFVAPDSGAVVWIQVDGPAGVRP